ncbi:MAG: hypothetical protein AAF901_03040 [Bacteroidota bacterium]
MKHYFSLLLVCTLMITISCKSDKNETEDTLENTVEEEKQEVFEVPKNVDVDKKVIVQLNSKNESSAEGKTIFSQKDGIVTMLASLKGLSQGDHAFRIDGKDNVINFTVKDNGRGTISMNTDEWCINCGDSSKDIVGKTIIVYQVTDDNTSPPSSISDKHVVCAGVIEE